MGGWTFVHRVAAIAALCCRLTSSLPAGGNATVNTSSVTDGAAVIQSAIDAFGGVTILVNNAGILRDKGCVAVLFTPSAVGLENSRAWLASDACGIGSGTCRTPILIRSLRYISRVLMPVPRLLGRISATKSLGGSSIRRALRESTVRFLCIVIIKCSWLNMCACVVVIGNFGQANYSAAKMGLIGFTKALAREGAKYNINAIAVAPVSFFWCIICDTC